MTLLEKNYRLDITLHIAMGHNKGLLATSNSFIEKCIELNIRNTVFNTNIEDFLLKITHFILLFTK